MSLLHQLPPGLILILGGLLLPLLGTIWQRGLSLALPLLSAAHLLALEPGTYGQIQMFGQDLVLLRVDPLSLIFAYIFHLAAFLGVIYSLHVKDTLQHVAGLAYAGAAICALFAGDLLTLFVFWELTAITSVFLIWARRTEAAYRTGLRYLIIQVGSGVILLAGLILWQGETGSLAFDYIGIDSTGGILVFLAFGIKAAFPLLHNWLQDAYPEATPTGTVFLSAFTTKLAIYALARGFPGVELLIWLGAIMTAFPIFYAVIENDLRRVLAYSLNNQLGFMVVGVGIGTELALNGTAAHAFAHILYKALLFMSMGAVLYRVGTVKGSELGGLYKSMPWTAAFCIVGAASISAFPLTSGFVSKSLTMSAAAGEGYWLVWGVLLFASAGVFHHSGIKIPFFAFFAHDRGIRVQEAPFNMLLAMGLTAAMCILIGVFPSTLYAYLPYPVEYVPYTVEHVITQLQLLMFSALAFAVLMRTGIYPPELRSVNLDFDVVYRKGLPAVARAVRDGSEAIRRSVYSASNKGLTRMLERLFHYHGPQGVLGRTWAIGSAGLWIVALLALYMVLYYT